MEQKLSLDAGSLKKSYASENVLVIKEAPQPTQRKFPLKKERRHLPTSLDSLPSGSQEHLDSGLGSYECHSPEASRCDRYCDTGSPIHPTVGDIATFRPITNPAVAVPTNPSATGGAAQHHSMGLPNSTNQGYTQPRYHSYGGGPVYPPVNMSQYSFPHSRGPPPQQGCWSDHYGGYPPASHNAMQPEGGHGTLVPLQSQSSVV